MRPRVRLPIPGTVAAVALALAAGMAAVTEPALAQVEGNTPVRRELGPWTATASFGRSLIGPAAELEAELRSEGWDHFSPGSCFIICAPGEDHPRTDRNGLEVLLGVRRDLGSRYSAELLAGRTPGQETVGYRSGTREHMRIGHALSWAGAVGAIHAGPFRLGAGPALYSTRVDRQRAGEGQRASRVSKAGAVLDAGFVTSRTARTFVEFRGQYRVVGSRSVGPVRSSPPGGSSFSAQDVSFDHLYLGIGLGVRF